MSRPTTLVESDQLAQAAVNILKNDEFVPKSRRWPFARVSKAHRDYEKAVQDITARRRSARVNAIEVSLKKDREDVDAAFERSKRAAQVEHSEKIAEARKPFDEADTLASKERDAAIAAANLAYQERMEAATVAFKAATAELDQTRDSRISDAQTVRTESYAVLEAKREAGFAQIARDMKTIPLEGPMRVVEDREAWPLTERKKALVGLVDMAGRDDVDLANAEVCLQNVAGYVYQDRFLKPDAQHHRLMDAGVLEALVDLAQRTPDRRPMVVNHLHQIVVHNPGHSSPAFIKHLTELYVLASTDTSTMYANDPIENEAIFDRMREQIADALRLTPRRSQVSLVVAEHAAMAVPDMSEPESVHDAPTAPVGDADITAEVDVRELVPLEPSEARAVDSEVLTAEAAARPSDAALAAHERVKARSRSMSPPPPMPPRRSRKAPAPEGSV